MHCKIISAKNFIGLKQQIFNPVNISTFTVLQNSQWMNIVVVVFMAICYNVLFQCLASCSIKLTDFITINFLPYRKHINNQVFSILYQLLE